MFEDECDSGDADSDIELSLKIHYNKVCSIVDIITKQEKHLGYQIDEYEPENLIMYNRNTDKSRAEVLFVKGEKTQHKESY
ncbi:hypothetical protein M0804_006576 [Polistes exclamans]|nr:hypothetical protein M0804_006576 [Polistes exclamans]